MRCTIAIPSTFEKLAFKLFNNISKWFNTMYVACDMYKYNKIKGNEGNSGGVSKKFAIHIPAVRVPPKLQHFINNDDNNEQSFQRAE